MKHLEIKLIFFHNSMAVGLHIFSIELLSIKVGKKLRSLLLFNRLKNTKTTTYILSLFYLTTFVWKRDILESS